MTKEELISKVAKEAAAKAVDCVTGTRGILTFLRLLHGMIFHKIETEKEYLFVIVFILSLEFVGKKNAYS